MDTLHRKAYMAKVDYTRLGDEELLALVIEQNRRHRENVDRLLADAAELKLLLELQADELRVILSRRGLRIIQGEQ